MSHRFLFYIDPVDISGKKVRFSRSESHHIQRVLRLGRGSQIEAADGSGYVYQIQLEEVAEGYQFGRILDKRLKEPKAPLPVSVAIPCLKGSRWEIAVEAACEMGVEAIYPADFKRASLKWIPSRIEKMRCKAVEIMKQSRGSRLTSIKEPCTLLQLIERVRFTEIWLADPEGDTISRIQSGALFIVGPEVGLDTDEEGQLGDFGARRFNLGNRRMRSEIAVVVSLAQVQLNLISK